MPVCCTHLEDMESFELDILALVAQQIHHRLEILFISYVARHDGEVGTVKQNFAEQLEGLSLGHVVARLHEPGVVDKELQGPSHKRWSA